MSTHIRLADLTDKALNLLKAQGLSASTLGGYTKKYEFLKKYFASLGSAYYDESLLSQFMVDYEEKHKNVMSLMPFLSEYMGHSSLQHTLYYIHLIPERLRNTSSIDWNSFSRIYGKGGEY